MLVQKNANKDWPHTYKTCDKTVVLSFLKYTAMKINTIIPLTILNQLYVPEFEY